MPVEREELKIRERRSEILAAVLWSMIEEKLSGPEAVSIGIREIRLQILPGLQRTSGELSYSEG